MRDEAFTEFHRVAGRHMRPFGAVKSRELGKIRVMNSGRAGHFQKWVPSFFPRRDPILKFFQSTGVRKPNENNLSTARPNFFDCSGHISKTFLNAFIHLREENILRYISGVWWRREERNPDLLNLFR